MGNLRPGEKIRSGEAPRKTPNASPRAARSTQLDRHARSAVLNEYFPPDTSATAKIAALVAERWLSAIASPSCRPAFVRSDRVLSLRFLRRETRNNVVVERVGSTAFPRFQMKRRVSNYLTYLALALPRALAIQSGRHPGDDGSAHRGNRRRVCGATRRPPFRLQHPRYVSGHGGGRRHRAPELVGRSAGSKCIAGRCAAPRA